MKTWIKIVLAIFVFVALFVLKTLFDAGSFKSINPHFDGQITEIGGFLNAEDIAIDQNTGIALISSGEFDDIPNAKRGDIWMIDLKTDSYKPINLTANLDQADFRPHGISLYQSPEGKKKLFVVNHRKSGNFIEIFEFTDSTLVYQKSISDPLIVSPNDVVGIGENSFYVTNDHNIPMSTKRMLSDYLQIGIGNVVYYDGQKATLQDEGLKYANGINVSKDGKLVFVGLSTGRSVVVYDKDATGKLSKIDELDLDTGVDNIDIDPDGNLWLGCHPQLLKFTAHAKNHEKLSPSQVLKVKYNGKGSFESTEVYLNNGKSLSASSVGAVWKNKLLIGGVFDDKILIGEMK